MSEYFGVVGIFSLVFGAFSCLFEAFMPSAGLLKRADPDSCVGSVLELSTHQHFELVLPLFVLVQKNLFLDITAFVPASGSC